MEMRKHWIRGLISGLLAAAVLIGVTACGGGSDGSTSDAGSVTGSAE